MSEQNVSKQGKERNHTMRSQSHNTHRAWGGASRLAVAGLTATALLIAACGGTATPPPASTPAAKASLAASAAPTAPSQASVPGETKEVTLIKSVRPNLVSLVDAAQKGDFAAARKALKAYNTAWNGVEVYVSYRAPEMYTEVEAVREAKVTSLLDATPPNGAEVLTAAQSVLAEYDLIIKTVSAGAPISPLFDDIAALRILRTNTIRDATPALKAGDVATAKPLLQAFLSKWDDVEDLIKVRSNDVYSDIEAAMAKVNSSLGKTSPTAAELTPLVATLSERFNYGISLVNAAARGADMSKKSFTTDDVQTAASLAAINNELKTSLTAWQGGKYADAVASAQRASGAMFAKVAGPLKAKNGADAAPQKALTAYADLAGNAGDATTVGGSQKAAVESILIAQQWIVGQFWSDSKLKDAISAALSAR
jgi:hypothetical protein